MYGKDYQPNNSTMVRENFYVDDCLVSVDDAETEKRLVKDLTELFSKGGLHLTKWLSTCNLITESIAVEERAKRKKVIDLSRDVSERVLGMKWFVCDDCFAYELTWAKMPATHRGLLSAYSSLFDSLGLVAPVVLKARLVFRSVCLGGLGWGNPFPKMKQ